MQNNPFSQYSWVFQTLKNRRILQIIFLQLAAGPKCFSSKENAEAINMHHTHYSRYTSLLQEKGYIKKCRALNNQGVELLWIAKTPDDIGNSPEHIERTVPTQAERIEKRIERIKESDDIHIPTRAEKFRLQGCF